VLTLASDSSFPARRRRRCARSLLLVPSLSRPLADNPSRSQPLCSTRARSAGGRRASTTRFRSRFSSSRPPVVFPSLAATASSLLSYSRSVPMERRRLCCPPVPCLCSTRARPSRARAARGTCAPCLRSSLPSPLAGLLSRSSARVSFGRAPACERSEARTAVSQKAAGAGASPRSWLAFDGRPPCGSFARRSRTLLPSWRPQTRRRRSACCRSRATSSPATSVRCPRSLQPRQTRPRLEADPSPRAGNKAASFPLQLLGWEVDPVLTVSFSNHTAS